MDACKYGFSKLKGIQINKEQTTSDTYSSYVEMANEISEYLSSEYYIWVIAQITILAVTLCQDLVCHLITWEAACEEVIADISPPKETPKNNQLPNFIQKAIDIMNYAASCPNFS